MKGVTKNLVILCALIMLGCSQSLAAPTISGKVVSIDVATSTIVVNSLKDVATDTYEEVAVLVTEGTKIEKGGTALKLSDIHSADDVVIKYTVDATGKKTAEGISLQVK